MRKEAQSLNQRNVLVHCISMQQCPSVGVENDKPTRTTSPGSLILAAKRANRWSPKPCTSTDDDSSLGWTRTGARTRPSHTSKQCRQDPILDPDSDSSLPVPDDSCGTTAKSDSQTKKHKILLYFFLSHLGWQSFRGISDFNYIIDIELVI